MPPKLETDHDILIRLDERVGAMHQKVDKLTDDHENRIRHLERETNRWLGKQSILGGMIGIFATIVAILIHAGLL